MKLSQLLHDTGIKCEDTTENRGGDPEISGVCCDSRRVKPGDLFVCLKGKNADGEEFEEEARQRGAAAILRRLEGGAAPDWTTAATLAARIWDHPDRKLTMIGVTGTNGKTTTTWMIRRILNRLGVGCGLIGTVVYETGDEALASDRTTPQPDQLYRLLHEMRRSGCTACAMEVSSHGLALGRVETLEFQYGVFTNLTEDHLDFHGTMEAYYRAKKKLFDRVKICSFINTDDPWGRRLYGELRAEGKPCFGLSLVDRTADLCGDVVRCDGAGSIVRLPQLAVTLKLALPGKWNCENALAAWAVCAAVMGNRAAEALEEMDGVPGRFEPVKNRAGRNVIVDYAHTPDALKRVLTTARPLVGEGGRLICVFGCGGDRDAGKRPLMGEISGRLADYTVITSDNPRTEDPEIIAEQIEEGMRITGGTYEILLDRKKAIEKALTLCGRRDIVVIAGKGHETTQTIGKKAYPFDDRSVAEELLKKLKK